MDMRKLKSWGESPSRAFMEGCEAREKGESDSDCLYLPETSWSAYSDWHLGWNHMNLYLSCKGMSNL